ncbi:Down-regulator of transcription 1 [Turnera subulata]|uniref:Down-regulator of transcription 1 n=1 Tax=Turnera subulata TaxID=218843 RepID=A0A9Q0FLH9_9ROSI|nr:Down-regulator of transcription 1 [Turnera subulata]
MLLLLISPATTPTIADSDRESVHSFPPPLATPPTVGRRLGDTVLKFENGADGYRRLMFLMHVLESLEYMQLNAISLPPWMRTCESTMTKIIKEMLPPDVRVARDAQDLLIECCVEFINLVSSESNEVCSREEKRTIAPEHVLKALEVLGFGEYIEEVYAAYEQHKHETLHDSLKGGGKWNNGAAMTEEEAAAEQQRMFAEARARMNGGAAVPKQSETDQGLES